VLSIAHRHAYNEALPTEALIFEGTAYDLSDESRTDLIPEQPIIPSLDHALYLINMVNFRCGQLYHLFDEGDFMRSLHDYYSNDRRPRDSLWYIHFLLILAFGKSFLQTRSQERKPPGIKYFAKAMQLLPDHNRLYSSPLVSTEILCCIAIFYQSLDCRSPAHNYVRFSTTSKVDSGGIADKAAGRSSYADGHEPRHAYLHASRRLGVARR
jgi:hypothetical protein